MPWFVTIITNYFPWSGIGRSPSSSVEKDRGNPGVSKVYPYPHPLKTPTLYEGRGFQPVGVRVARG